MLRDLPRAIRRRRGRDAASCWPSCAAPRSCWRWPARATAWPPRRRCASCRLERPPTRPRGRRAATGRSDPLASSGSVGCLRRAGPRIDLKPRRRGARRALRHLLQRHAVPRDGAGGGRAARAARPRGRVPGGADVLRADARQHRLRGARRRAGAALGAGVRRVRDVVVSPSASCVGYVREHVPSSHGRLFELTEFLVDRLGVTDVGASFPHRVTLHPTCHSLRMLHVGDRPRRLLEAVRGIDLVDLEDADECCGFGGTFAVKNADTSMAMLGDKLRRVLDTRAEVCTAADNSCLMHIGGALRRQRAGVRDHAPGRDPGGAGMTGLSRRRARDAAERAAAAQPRQGDDDDPRQAAAGGRGAAGLGGAARRGRGDQGARDGDAARAARAARGVGARAPAASCTGRATGRRRTRSWRAIARSHGAREVVKVKSIATDEIGLNDALAAQGISAIETDLAELILQLSQRQDLAHPGAGHPPQPDGDQGAVRAHDHRREAGHRGVGDRRGGAAAPARQVPLGAGGGVGRELRRRRDRHGGGGRVRGQRAHVHDAAEGARHRDGDREGPARVARPRGLPAAAAAVARPPSG